MKLSNHNNSEFSSPYDMDPVYGSRLIPESDLDKALLLHVICQAVERMGEWHSCDGDYVMYINIPVDAEVADDGSLAAKLVAQPTEFDRVTFFSAWHSEEVTLHVEQHPAGRIDVVWVAGKDSNYVAPNCWIVRNYD